MTELGGRGESFGSRVPIATISKQVLSGMYRHRNLDFYLGKETWFNSLMEDAIAHPKGLAVGFWWGGAKDTEAATKKSAEQLPGKPEEEVLQHLDQWIEKLKGTRVKNKQLMGSRAKLKIIVSDTHPTDFSGISKTRTRKYADAMEILVSEKFGSNLQVVRLSKIKEGKRHDLSIADHVFEEPEFEELIEETEMHAEKHSITGEQPKVIAERYIRTRAAEAQLATRYLTKGTTIAGIGSQPLLYLFFGRADHSYKKDKGSVAAKVVPHGIPIAVRRKVEAPWFQENES